MPARLIIDHHDGWSQEIALPPDGVVTLGRSRKSTVYLNDGTVSGQHAKLSFHDGQWFLSDAGSMNRTFLDNREVQHETPLEHGQVIRIGGVLLRFCTCEQEDEPASTQVGPEQENQERPFARIGEGSDEDLSIENSFALLQFVKQSLDESSHLNVIRRGLETILSQVGADRVGFLSFDPDAPVPRLVIPQRDGLDVPLSRELTVRVRQSGRTVWRGEEERPGDISDSLSSYRDAFCVPVGGQDAPQGAIHVYADGKRFNKLEIGFTEALADCLNRCLKQLHKQRSLRAENQRLRQGPQELDEMVGNCPAMQTLRLRIQRAATSICRNILITGESGTGKELVAHELHCRSARAGRPLVIVNCASLPDKLADGHLFGYEKGAFTDAKEGRLGYFREADDGTLFLDEIAELPLELQPKLLRVIEGKGYRPLGAKEDVFVDVRVLAATNKDLAALVEQGKFREDLRRRFELTLAVPPLRDRGDDIADLTHYLLQRLTRDSERNITVSKQAIERLASCPWPGNIRQLRSVLTEAITFNDKNTIDADDLDLSADAGDFWSRPHSLKLEDVEAWAIRKALRLADGKNLTRVAEILGIHVDTLRAKMRKYGIGKDA
jgi:two-component system, NtrC family, response regulator HydG